MEGDCDHFLGEDSDHRRDKESFLVKDGRKRTGDEDLEGRSDLRIIVCDKSIGTGGGVIAGYLIDQSMVGLASHRLTSAKRLRIICCFEYSRSTS